MIGTYSKPVAVSVYRSLPTVPVSEEGAPVPELKDPGWQAAHALDATEPVPVP